MTFLVNNLTNESQICFMKNLRKKVDVANVELYSNGSLVSCSVVVKNQNRVPPFCMLMHLMGN
jgi:hypothetical protein